MKKLIEYLPIITVSLIYFGFCNLYYYYKEFNVDVSYYISNTEILISFLPTIVILSSTLYFFFYSKLINLQNTSENDPEKLEKNTSIEEVHSTKKKNKILNFILTLNGSVLIWGIIGISTYLILTKFLGYKPHELKDIILTYSCLLLILVYFSSEIINNKELINKNILLFTFFTVLYLGLQIGIYRKFDADKIKEGIANKGLEFRYKNKKINTSKKFVFIGQTQSHLFIYDLKNKSTLVYKTENIDSLIIK